jgi:hypothetical protein
MKLQRFVISGEGWGDIQVLRPTPVDGDPWGELAPLRDTAWGDLIPEVEGTVFSHALHGHIMPLVRVLGRDPKALLRAIPEEHRPCKLRDGCVMHKVRVCHPCPKVPDCFMPSSLEESHVHLAGVVVRAWAEGRYVLVVRGPEFSF